MSRIKIDRTKEGWKSNCVVIKRVTGMSACWEWKYGCTGHGRPVIFTHRIPEHAARFACRLFNGILKGIATHKCDNKKCVRPSHIEDSTYSKNAIDYWKRNPTAKRHRKNLSINLAKLHKNRDFSENHTLRNRKRMDSLWKTSKWRNKMSEVLHRRNHPIEV